MLRVAITRAQPEADRTAERVRALGHEAIVAPLITIVPCGYDTSTQGAQAIIFTSSNGVRAFPDARGARDRIVLTVGDVTAAAAREAGFNDVRSADGDVRSLAALVKRELDPAKGKLIHIAGDHVAGDLGGELRAAGFSVERRLAYASVAAGALPEVLTGPLDIVLFHSTRALRCARRTQRRQPRRGLHERRDCRGRRKNRVEAGRYRAPSARRRSPHGNTRGVNLPCWRKRLSGFAGAPKFRMASDSFPVRNSGKVSENCRAALGE